MPESYITAVEMARSAGIDPKTFRRALRAEAFPWHGHNERWTVPVGSPQHNDMLRVLRSLTGS